MLNCYERNTLTLMEFADAEREAATAENDPDLQCVLASTAWDEARGTAASVDADEAIDLYVSKQKKKDHTCTGIFNPDRDGDCLLRAAVKHVGGSTRAEDFRALVAERAGVLAALELHGVTARIHQGMFADPMNKGALENLLHILDDVSNDILPDFAFKESLVLRALVPAESTTVPNLETALMKFGSSLTHASTRRELAIKELLNYNSGNGNVLGDDALQPLADVTGAIVEV